MIQSEFFELFLDLWHGQLFGLVDGDHADFFPMEREYDGRLADCDERATAVTAVGEIGHGAVLAPTTAVSQSDIVNLRTSLGPVW